MFVPILTLAAIGALEIVVLYALSLIWDSLPNTTRFIVMRRVRYWWANLKSWGIAALPLLFLFLSMLLAIAALEYAGVWNPETYYRP
ncbi:hypothetical protein [Larkinella arboricola]